MSRRLQILVAVVLAGLWGAFIWSAHGRGHLAFLDRVQAAITDFETILLGVKPPPDAVTIVEIDDALVKQAGSFPLPRLELGRVVQAIARLKPRVIALDILLLDKGSDAGDETVPDALAAGPTVIAGAALFPELRQSIDVENREDPIAGLPESGEISSAIEEVFRSCADRHRQNPGTDRTGTPRSMPMLFRTSDSVEMSLPLRVAALATASHPTIEPHRLTLGQLSVPTDSDFAAPHRILWSAPNDPDDQRPLSAGGRGGSPGDREQDCGARQHRDRRRGFLLDALQPVMPGVEVVSTAIAQLVSATPYGGTERCKSWMDDNRHAADVLVGMLAWRRSTAGILRQQPWVSAGRPRSGWHFRSGVWLDAAVPVAATAPPFVLFGAIQLRSGRSQAQYFAMKSRLLGQFQAPEIQEWLTRNPRFLAEPVSQNAAIIFIDLSGFTSVSEGYGPHRVQELLKDFHALVDHEVVSSRGTVISFQGDGAMILFGLPEAAGDDALRAADCAVRLCVATQQWLTSLPASIGSKLGFKVGAHFGVIVASRLGGESHHHITATGDTVNVASRLMEIAAHRGFQLAVGDELLRAAGPDCALLKTGTLSGPQRSSCSGPLWQN